MNETKEKAKNQLQSAEKGPEVTAKRFYLKSSRPPTRKIATEKKPKLHSMLGI